METIIFLSIIIIGTVFGSFFTLAVYRIPRKENITYVRSHCTSCNHKLRALDLIPIFSYIFLGGKCRYCKEKIRIRYLLLEVFSGLVFLLMALTRDVQDIPSIINLAFIYLFMAGMFIIAGIDKEKQIIPNSLCIYELVIAIIHFAYLFFTKESIVDNVIGALIIPIIFLIINKLVIKLTNDKEKCPIGLGDIKYLSIIGLMFGFSVQILSIVLSSIITLIGVLIHKYKEIPWGYYLTIATIIVLIFLPYLKDLTHLIKIWG